MEEVAKTIENTFKPILPREPHTLSPHPTVTYPPSRDSKLLEEQLHRPLQYTTFVSDADRGVLLARAWFDIHEDDQTSHANNTPLRQPLDSKKPKTKLSLKDYKNRKEAPEGESPPKPRLPALKEQESSGRSLETTPKPDMDVRRERPPHNSSSTLKSNTHRMRSPSPSRPKKRLSEAAEHDTKPIKRQRQDDAPSSQSDRDRDRDRDRERDRERDRDRILPKPPKSGLPPKPERVVPAADSKKPIKDARPSPLPNGKRPLSNSGVSTPTSKTNGVPPRSVPSSTSVVKKMESNPKPKAYVPPLLSPLHLGGLDDKKPSPKKRPDESGRPMSKKPRDDRDTSPSPKKRKPHSSIPPLLSPTLPPIVMEELARQKKALSASSKDSSDSQKGNSQITSSQRDGATKATKTSTNERTIHVDSRYDGDDKDKPDTHIVVLKYKRRLRQTIERILRLEPKGKRFARDRSDSIEPGVAKKRPRMAEERSGHITEAGKRPRPSEALQPATPSNRHSAAMQRVASSSSQVGTPGLSQQLTPAPPAAESQPRRPSINPEQMQRLMSKSGKYIELGTSLKHQRDRTAKTREPPKPGIPPSSSERDKDYSTMSFGIQSLLSYMLGFKLENDARDLERKPRAVQSYKSLQPLFGVVRRDCGRHGQLSALLLRMQGVLLVHMGQALAGSPESLELMKEIVQNSKDQQDTWRMAEKARRGLGIFEGGSGSGEKNEDGGGEVGKLLDRLGPWTSPEEAIPIVLEILKRAVRLKDGWKPVEELARYARGAAANGSREDSR